MTTGEFFKRFLAILLVTLLCLGLWAARSTLLSAFAAAMIAVGLGIPTGWLVRHGWPRGWAIAAAVLAFLNLILLIVLLIVPRLVSGFIDLLSNIPDALNALFAFYMDLRERSTFLRDALPVPVQLGDEGQLTPTGAEEILQRLINASLAIAPSLLGGVNTVVAVVINLGFVIFIAIFFLIEPQSYVKASLFLLPMRYHARAVEIWNTIHHTVRIWLSTIFLSISITMALVWLILGLLLGMPNAIVVAVFAGFATFIPNIGFFLPVIPIAVFTLASDPQRLLIYIAVYLLIQFLESNIITPTLVKSELSIPPGGLMVFQLLATLAFGALGLLLAVPLLAVLIVLVREIYSYDLLHLRGVIVDAAVNGAGEVTVEEWNAEVPPERKPLPKQK